MLHPIGNLGRHGVWFADRLGGRRPNRADPDARHELALDDPVGLRSIGGAQPPAVWWQFGRPGGRGDVGPGREALDLGIDIGRMTLDQNPAAGAVPQYGAGSKDDVAKITRCLLYTSPSPRD